MYSLRLKLNDVIGLSSKECEDFVKRNENLLFQIKTKITSKNSPFDSCWFLINSDGNDLCKKRYSYNGDILNGIAEYVKIVKYLKGKEHDKHIN